MKKLSIIILMLVYGLSSSGITVSLHYCCGKLDNVSLTAKGNTCKMGNHEKKDGCCNDKQFSSSIASDQETTVKYVQPFKPVIALPAFAHVNTTFKSNIFSVDLLARGRPELLSSIPLFIKNRVFRI